MIRVDPKHTRIGRGPGEDDARFGPMRVCSDDVIAPRGGSGSRAYAELEIVTVAFGGKLRYEDDLGNVAVAGYGDVQRLSAGTGVAFAEANPSDVEPAERLRLGFEPAEKGLTPSFETASYDPASLVGDLVPIVTPDGGPNEASIRQHLAIFLSRLPAGETVEFMQGMDRRVFLFVVEGSIYVTNVGDPTETATLRARDTARITETPDLKFTAAGEEEAFFLLVDLP